ncbi:cation-translocating P-type ATPase C-terminal domain-containing protein [Streptomyces sp. NRRL F-5727]|uniref:cation-translocating P-type ATPase C-terminal domain-containing protein n=1 Tax=Streptomyces sp. NRRL F-5727 TaxID=1463871 RepID=UPI002277386F|nr:cation-translocating P-type ATPase C-terminal domain-containing protein [Streptomyces sp. NRRL F-5727]
MRAGSPATRQRPAVPCTTRTSRPPPPPSPGIVTCQVGTAFAARTDHAALRAIGVLSNPLLLAGIAFELAFTAALVYAPPLQRLFGTAALPLDVVLLIMTFPVLVWGTDELRRSWRRRHGPLSATASVPPWSRRKGG